MIPKYLTKDELLAVLDDLRAHIEANDSFEGSFEYTFPEQGDPSGDGFRVRASYRIGNSMGQGGMRMVGEFA